ISESVSLPLNLALTGPTRATISTWYSLSPLGVIDSQPGTQALRTSGSLSPFHTACCGAGISCSPFISMRVSPGCCASAARSRCGRGRRGSSDYAPAGTGRRAAAWRARRACLELVVAQQRVQPHQVAARLGEALHLLAQAFALIHISEPTRLLSI